MSVRVVLALPVLASCSVGLHSSLARRGADPLTLQSPTRTYAGTAELSSRTASLDVGGLLPLGAFAIEVGAQLGASNPEVGATTGDIPKTDRKLSQGFKPEHLSGFDAYYAGAILPLTSIEHLTVAAYADLAITGIARTIRDSSGPTSQLEAGIELELPYDEQLWFVRVGLQRQSLELRFATDEFNIRDEQATGSASLVGLAFAFGVTFEPRGDH